MAGLRLSARQKGIIEAMRAGKGLSQIADRMGGMLHFQLEDEWAKKITKKCGGSLLAKGIIQKSGEVQFPMFSSKGYQKFELTRFGKEFEF